MAQTFAFEAAMTDTDTPTTWLARRGPALAWLLVGLLALVLCLPLRYTSHAELSFEMATQPAPAVVRGNIQLLSSRELAFEVARALGPVDTKALAAQSTPLLTSLWRRPDGDEAALMNRAARTLAEALAVSAQQNGRALDIAVSLPDAARARRVANAYAGALLTLDASVREGADAPRDPAPTLRLASPASSARMPDLPSTGALVLLAIAAGLAAATTLHLRRRPARLTGAVVHNALPQECPSDRRVSWLRSTAGGSLAPDAAVDRLMDTVGSAEKSDLVILTSGDLPDESAACSLMLARRLADSEDQVVFVALDGEASILSRLTLDPRAPGMAELLFGVASFSECIHRDVASRAHLIPPGRDNRSGASVVNAERLTLILQALRQTYSRVIVAAPGLAGTPGAERLAALSPLLIALHEDTTGAVEAYDGLAAKGFARVVMLPLNFADDAREADTAPETDAALALPVPSLMTPVQQPASHAA
ncbi:hypothetical protein GCM10007301_18940 [Azorhizobium oxalatiphilum]|uniref:Uncharacterized protein n=1 Tax=Azorhizobium oxalatiphilum TaxID=980631 RepID=A0A917FA97_9HYPH|nr:hypothetical protein [Azorhizobium oxalatiphilum]GGF59413.1 hypothetical protein GCM10007301_18940 [Azorhizobium oxalatiphilum]